MKILMLTILYAAAFLTGLVCFGQKAVSNRASTSVTKALDLHLPQLFSNGMVVQRNQKIPVWGWAPPGTHISVQFKNQVQKTKAAKNGRWLVKLNEEPEGGPFTMMIKGGTSITIEDVWIGDVWVCSGQSNMEFPVRLSLNAEKEMKEANYPMIRQFGVPKTVSLQPADTLKGGNWKICSPETVGNFTAAGYFFARDLYRQLNVPIGLINTNIGGTHVETWMSKEGLEKEEGFAGAMKMLPTTSVETISKQRMEAMKKKIDSLQASVPVSTNVQEWMINLAEDERGPVMTLPGLWENKGWPELDGKMWFRKDVFINAADTGKVALLELGSIDDTDESYINGVKVGATKNKPVEDRRYNVPKSILHAGKNTVTIGIEDTGGGGGFGGKADKMKITVGNVIYPLKGNWHYKIESLYPSGFAVYPNTYPTLLYNAMIHPLIPYAIKGVIWYQGEANAERAYQYRTTFPALIKDWRRAWGEGDFPFLFVQLASFNAAPENIQRGSTWAELREAQAMALRLPLTGMAVAIDIGEANDIHPKNKQEVGKRLALVALNKVYGKPVVAEGPTFTSMKTEGNKVILHFQNADNGFLIKDRNGYIKGFTIAGADKHFQYAKAYVDGTSIVVYHDAVTSPVAVRYAWADNAEDANLFNKEGLPVVPFRTDAWDGITKNNKYKIGD